MNQLICESSMQNGSINTVQGRAFTAASVLERKVFVCVLTAFQRIESSSALFFLFLSRISRDLVIRRWKMKKTIPICSSYKKIFLWQGFHTAVSFSLGNKFWFTRAYFRYEIKYKKSKESRFSFSSFSLFYCCFCSLYLLVLDRFVRRINGLNKSSRIAALKSRRCCWNYVREKKKKEKKTLVCFDGFHRMQRTNKIPVPEAL